MLYSLQHSVSGLDQHLASHSASHSVSGTEEGWSPEQHEAEIVCLLAWNYGSTKLKPPGGWKLQVLKGDHQALGGYTRERE